MRTTRPTRSLALRSTLSNNWVSELRGGITRGERLFFGRPELDAPTASTFDDTNAFAIDLDSNIGLTNWHVTNTLSSRSGYQYTLDETLNWLKGAHSVTIGGGAFLGRAWDDSQQLVPGIDLRFDTTNDPAAGLFGAANFPGASAAQLADARDLYALLTGRVGAVTGQAALDPETETYTAFGRRRRAGKLDVFSAFLQDSWRVTSTLTLNAGVRWDVQMPFAPSNDTMTTASLADICGVSGVGQGGLYSACNFYAPGASGGKVPEFAQFTSGTRGYNTDWNNLAPNIGAAWRPDVQGGWLRALLGDPDQATLRAGYSEAFERQGIGGFTGIYGPNPGSTLSLTRDANTGLVGPGESWPVLLRETDRLYQAPFPATPTFPIPIRPNRADNINAFHPDIEVASARSWTIGLQRALTQQHGTRGALCRYSWRQSVVDEQLQRAERHRERLSRRVQAGDEEPAGQQPRRRQPRRIVRVLWIGHGHQSASDLSRVSERAEGRGQSRRVHRWRGNVDEYHVRRAPRAHESEPELRQLDDRDFKRGE